MNERLVFGYGTTGFGGTAPAYMPAPAETPAPAAVFTAEKEPRRDWAFLGLLAFTAVLYFRPQDQIPGLHLMPFAEIAAIFALTAMILGRTSRGLPVTRVTPELIAVAAFGLLMLATAPFSVWVGGAVGTFTDLFVKVLLIYVLMTNTLITLPRLHKFTTIVVVTTGYLATRAIIDYLRGFNLVENGRVQGAVGGMFQNPNDMALNMVAVLPIAFLVTMRAKTLFWRLLGAGTILAMIWSVIVSYSRGGFIGLAVMMLIVGFHVARRRPSVAAGAALAFVLALPLVPPSYWDRMSSITDDSRDATGSREARRTLLREAWNTFLAFPVTGVGAGMFQAYNPPGRVEIWRETHNVVLQVAAELGIVGLAIFGFLLWRAFTAGRTTRRLLRRATGSSPPSRWSTTRSAAQPAVVTRDEAVYLDAHAAAMSAAVIGWFVCALFASVAYSWTFYYLLALAVAPRDILAGRLAARAKTAAAPQPVGARA